MASQLDMTQFTKNFTINNQITWKSNNRGKGFKRGTFRGRIGSVNMVEVLVEEEEYYFVPMFQTRLFYTIILF